MGRPNVEAKETKMGGKVFQSLWAIEQKLKKSCAFPILIISSAVLYFIQLCLSAFAGNPKISHGIFNRSIGDVSKMFPLNVTPAGWTFSIWGVIFLLQIGSAIYSLGTLCRQTAKGSAYLHPPVLSPLYYVLFSLSSIFVIGWLFMWEDLMFVSSSIFLLCCMVCLWTAFSIASERLSFYRSELIDSGRSVDVTAITIVVINGLGMYATWTVVATLLNLGVTVVYRVGKPLSDETASIVIMSCIGLFVILYPCLDMIVYERINRFTFSPYITIIWALAGVISGNWDPTKVSLIMAASLLGCDVIALCFKIGLTIYRQMSHQNPYRRMNVAVPLN